MMDRVLASHANSPQLDDAENIPDVKLCGEAALTGQINRPLDWNAPRVVDR
jgi:hypothetical protein